MGIKISLWKGSFERWDRLSIGRDWEEGRGFPKGGKCLSREVGTEKHCPDNLEVSICSEFNYRLDWAITLNGFAFIAPDDCAYVFVSD